MAFEVTEVQHRLKGADYPARGAQLAELARSKGASEELADALADIDDELGGPDDVAQHLEGSLTGSTGD